MKWRFLARFFDRPAIDDLRVVAPLSEGFDRSRIEDIGRLRGECLGSLNRASAVDGELNEDSFLVAL